MIIYAAWQPVLGNDPRDIDWELRIAGYVATIWWRADYVSWDVTGPDVRDSADGEYMRETANGGYHADSNTIDDDATPDVVAMSPLYDRAKREAEAAILLIVDTIDGRTSSVVAVC